MESDLKRKQNDVRVRYLLLKERLNGLTNCVFEIKEEILNSMMSTEQGCDILLYQFKALNQGLDKIWSPKEGNHKRDNDLI